MDDSLSALLLPWYAENRRDLPWRRSRDPYAVWVSEIMLQQTRVDTVIPFFHRWMARFPDITALASGTQQEVLVCWEGLGYYSRARNLHKAAQEVVECYGGVLPEDPRQLQSLPGIGEYTAAAIASIAFGQDIAAVDGNIRRVYARVFDVRDPLGTGEAENRFRTLSAAHLPEGRAGEYNQALMDLGALICIPRSPRCDRCPIQQKCLAKARGVQEGRPVRKPRPDPPHHAVAAAVIRKDGRVLISQRAQDGLLGGLWEYPGGKQKAGEGIQETLVREVQEELGVLVRVKEPLGIYRHAYTHFRVTLHAFDCELISGDPQRLQVANFRWVHLDELGDYPMGKIDRQISLGLIERLRPRENGGRK